MIPDELLASNILEVYGELGYDAIGVGDQEFSNGIDYLLQKKDYYPFLANNLSICPDENRCIIFSFSPLILKRGYISCAVFAVLDPEVFTLYPEELKDKIKLIPPVTAVENLISLPETEEIDIRILLFHGSVENAIELSKKISGVEVIIAGHEQRLVDAQRVESTIVVSPGEEGNRIGILSLTISQGHIVDFSNEFILFEYMQDPDDPGVRKRIDRYREKLRSILRSESAIRPLPGLNMRS